MTDYLQEEIERLAKVRKDQMMDRLKSLPKNASSEPLLLNLIAELLISIEYRLNMSKRL